MEIVAENYSNKKIVFKQESKQGESVFEQFSIEFAGKSTRWPLYLAIIVLSIIFYASFTLQTVLISLPVLFTVAFMVLKSDVSKEVLLVIPQVGIQETVYYTNGSSSVKFHDQKSIKDVIITESVTMMSVTYYICILQHTQNNSSPPRLIPLFGRTRPRLDILKQIYKKIQTL